MAETDDMEDSDGDKNATMAGTDDMEVAKADQDEESVRHIEVVVTRETEEGTLSGEDEEGSSSTGDGEGSSSGEDDDGSSSTRDGEGTSSGEDEEGSWGSARYRRSSRERRTGPTGATRATARKAVRQEPLTLVSKVGWIFGSGLYGPG